MARLLLDRGADIEAQDWEVSENSFVSFPLVLILLVSVCQHKSTPLHMASNRGHVDVVRLLLDRGADARARNKVSEQKP